MGGSLGGITDTSGRCRGTMHGYRMSSRLELGLVGRLGNRTMLLWGDVDDALVQDRRVGAMALRDTFIRNKSMGFSQRAWDEHCTVEPDSPLSSDIGETCDEADTDGSGASRDISFRRRLFVLRGARLSKR
jgi:hypothetical protein